MGRWLAIVMLASSGCTFAVSAKDAQCAGSADSRGGSRDPTTATADDDAEPSAESDGPPPAHPSDEEGTFEVVARLMFKSIPYKDCGNVGDGDVDVTFIASGSVQKVVWTDDWTDATKQCVAERFAMAHVAPFAGGPRTVRWHAVLEESEGWGL